ncbi:hypothetical protein Trydic_g16118 [Trypoxylus dichotomus]
MHKLAHVPSKYGIGYQLFHHMKKHKDLVAQIDAQTEEEDTFDNLLQRCIRAAIELKARGISSNDVICVSSYNQLNACVPYVAGLFIGTKICALDWSMCYSDCKHLLSLVHPRIIFADAEKRNMYQELSVDTPLETQLVIFNAEDDDNNSFQSFLRESQEEDTFEPAKIESDRDTAIIMFSSGTTGLAKGICLSHYAIIHQAMNFGSFGFNTYRSLVFTSLYWISSVFIFVQSVLSGSARILYKSFNSDEVWKAIDKFKVTMLFLASKQTIEMIKVGRPDRIDTTGLLDVIIGGSHLLPQYVLALRDLLPGTNVFLGYGLTEVAGSLTTFRTNLRKDLFLLHNKPKSCGRPVPGFYYKVVDLENDQVLGCNQIGELRVQGDCIFNGYYNMSSTDAWDAENWLRTGDVVYYDEDFCFYIIDRVKEMLKYQSWHIAPAFLEALLAEHPAVKSAVVIGVPHEEDGEHPLGVVILAENFENVTSKMLVDYVNAKVEDDRQKLRAGVVFVKELPYTPSGKVKRKLLKEQILEGLSGLKGEILEI